MSFAARAIVSEDKPRGAACKTPAGLAPGRAGEGTRPYVDRGGFPLRGGFLLLGQYMPLHEPGWTLLTNGKGLSGNERPGNFI